MSNSPSQKHGLFILVALAVSLFSFVYFSLKLPLTVKFYEFGQWYYYSEVLWEISGHPGLDKQEIFDLIARPEIRKQEKFPKYEAIPTPKAPAIYLPILYLAFRPFLFFSYEVASRIWYILVQLSLSGTLFLFLKLFAKPIFPWKGPLILLAFFNFFPVPMIVEAGQIDFLTLFLVSSSFYFFVGKKGVLSGLCLGLALFTKLSPLPLLLYFAWIRRWRIVLSAGLLVTLGLALSISVLGWDFHFIQWSKAIPYFLQTSAATIYNQGLSSFWYHLFTQRGTEYPHVYGLCHNEALASFLSWASRGLLLGFALWSSRSARHVKVTPNGFSLFIVISLILSPWTSAFHMIYLLFPLVYLLAEEPLRRSEVPCLIAAYLLTGMDYWLDGFSPFRRGLGVLFLHGRLYGMLLLAVILMRRIKREKET